MYPPKYLLYFKYDVYPFYDCKRTTYEDVKKKAQTTMTTEKSVVPYTFFFNVFMSCIIIIF